MKLGDAPGVVMALERAVADRFLKIDSDATLDATKNETAQDVARRELGRSTGLVRVWH